MQTKRIVRIKHLANGLVCRKILHSLLFFLKLFPLRVSCGKMSVQASHPQGHQYRAGLSLLLSCCYGTFIYELRIYLRQGPTWGSATAMDRKGSDVWEGRMLFSLPSAFSPNLPDGGRPSSELPANYSSHLLGHWSQTRLGSQCEETFLPALVALDNLVPVNPGKDLCVRARVCMHVRVCARIYVCVMCAFTRAAFFHLILIKLSPFLLTSLVFLLGISSVPFSSESMWC